MKLEMFSIYDHKAKAYIRPFFTPNSALAIRAITDAQADPTHMFHKHPEDFGLYHLGTFDDATGGLEVIEPAQALGLVTGLSEDYDLKAVIPGERSNAKAG